MIIENREITMITIGNSITKVSIPSWQQQGFTVNIFNGIIPSELNNRKEKINFDHKVRIVDKTPTPFTDTEKAVWYSHFELWKRCVSDNIPIMIVEEDVVPIRKIPKNWKIDGLKTLCWNENKISPAGCYIITPKKAETMIENCLNRKITYNVDAYIKAYRSARNICKVKYTKQLKRVSTIAHL